MKTPNRSGRFRPDAVTTRSRRVTTRAVAPLLACFALFLSACGGDSSATGGGGGTSDGGGDSGIRAAGDAGTSDGGDDATTASFTLSGTASGLAGAGLTLQNGSETLAVSASGAFAFKTPVASGATYNVTVATQPSMPTQTCTVANGSGAATAAVTNVTVTCATSNFTVGGTVVGLVGTGLVLQDNNADSFTVSADGAFTFATPVASGNAFSVTVMTQPSGPTQLCTVVGGTGTVGSANVTDVMVNCSTTNFVIGGQITGLAGNSVVLQDNGGDNVTVNANGTFAFAARVASGANYAVSVLTQPSNPTETCTVSTGAGKVGSANVTSVNVACSTNTYTVGGAVSGLAGTGLVLQDNAGDNLTVSANGAFTFATSVASGANYAVTVLTQPQSATQTCAVTMGTGTAGSANVTNVAVACTTNTYTVGGTIAGLAATDSIVLQDNGGDDLTVSASGTFTFAIPVASGANYAVTVLTQPGVPAQTCTVSGDTGTVVAGNVTSVTVNCATNTYTIGGTVSGLAGTLVLQDNGADNVTLSTNGTFAFATPIASGVSYAVTALTQPGSPAQTCVIANGSGSVTNANVTSVTVTCTTNTYTVGGTISGLATNESVVLQDNGADNLTVGANGTFTFATSVASGLAYAVTVLTNPASPITQTCAVASVSNTIGAANVTNVTVTCTTNTYTVGGTVTGLAGTSLVLQDNGGDNLSLTSNGAFSFATSITSGGMYAVTLFQNPSTPSQTCVVASDSGTVTNANITSVTVTCTTNQYTVGGTVSGLATGDSLVLQDNGANNLTVSASGTFAFPAQASGSTYAATVLSESGATAQSCVITGDTGTVGGANVTSVAINCTTNTYTIGGNVSGLVGTGLVLQDNGANNLTIAANGSFAFATPIASDATYAVTILTNPTTPSQTCVVGNGTGTVAAANVTNVTITCTTNRYTIGGTLSGVAAGDSVVLQDNGADNLTLSANGSFTFATSIPSGSNYAATVLTNPANPSQACVVTAGSGTVSSANVTNIVVTCTTNTCAATTNNNCVLTTTNSGSTDIGTCASGFVGACSFQCNSGTFTQVTDTCAPPFLSHNIFDGTYAYMSGWNSNVLYKLNGSTGAITTVTSSAPSGGFTLAFNNGVLYAANPWATPTLLYKVNTTTGAFTTFATIGAVGDAIDGIWFDPSGNVYMNGTSNNVYKVTPAGVVSTFINNDGHLNGNTTQGISDSAGNLYIPSRSIAEIIKYNSAGTYQATLTTTCAPWGIAIASSGNLLYTCDTGIVYTLNLSTLASSTFASPGGSLAYLSVDSSGNVYVGSWTGTAAWKLSPAGATLWTVSLPAGEASAF